MKRLIGFATRYIPRHYLQIFARSFFMLVYPFYRGDKFEDPIDGKTFRKMLPYGRIVVRENAIAPYSMSLERHRLIWLFLKAKTNIFTAQNKMLHIAPEYCFKIQFSKLKNLDYMTGDLISPWADVKMNIKDIPFPENNFDILMCNHVLEHIDDDRTAMQELFRVMKPGGFGIFMVPMDYSLEKTLEDPTITDPREREKHYGQSDHVRQYGLDYPQKLAAVGFKVTEYDFKKELTEALVERYALPKDELIYYCEKPSS